MAYYFALKRVATYTDHFTYLDGDPKKVENLDRSVDVGINPPESNLALYCGRAIDPTYLPTRLQPKGRRYKLADLIGSTTGLLASEKVRDIVEEFEPGVHAFYPVTFEWSGKSGQKDKGHFIWIIQQSIKGLHPELIEPPYPGPNEFWDGYDLYKNPDRKLVFSKEAIGNAHIWTDPQVGYQRFISDELTEAFRAAQVIGFDPQIHIEVV
ncbi:MAG: hypothetical protein CR993_08530 [Rhodobacterales bacterium]|nr:MAG: hypothetical protein CR993_08530 [Rhodobacterales bacterium]